MPFREARNRLTEQLVGELSIDLDTHEASMADFLARKCLASTALEDIEKIHIPSFRGTCLEMLDLGRTRRAGHSAIRIFDPRQATHAWPSQHTAIAVVTDDMPFLVDSITGELGRRELNIHAAVHPQISVRRSAGGQLADLVERGTQGEDVLNESFMLFEVDAQTAQATLVDLETSLLKILGKVRAAVEDWQALREANRDATRQLEIDSPSHNQEELAEAREFLRWIDDQNFTYLGCLEYRLDEEGGDQFLRPVSGSGLGLWRKIPLQARARGQQPLGDVAARFVASQQLIAIGKSTRRSPVHRPVHMDVISVKKYSGDRLVGIYRFIGLFTSVAYSIRASQIPLIRRKVQRVIERAGFLPASHNGKGFRHVVETYSRDELFQISEEDLYRFGLRILNVQLRPRLALLVRHDEGERFVSCLVFVPRDVHSTHLRRRFEQLLGDFFQGKALATYTYISDVPLAQVRFIIQVSPGEIPDYDVGEIEARLLDASRTWSDRLKEALTDALDEEKGLARWRRYADAFPPAYAAFGPISMALGDIPLIERVLDRSTFAMRLYRRSDSAISRFHLRTFELAVPAPLSDLLPKIENMGLQVIAEIPFKVLPDHASNPVWVRDWELAAEGEVDLAAIEVKFVEAFRRVWRGEMEDDPFNKLVISAGLDWRQTVLLRAYAKYLRQIGTAFAQRSMARTLASSPEIVRLFVDLFATLLDPNRGDDETTSAGETRDRIEIAFESIRGRDDDRILRHYLNLIEATLRTNYFQTVEGIREGRPVQEPKPYLSLKLDAPRVTGMPEPRPRYEIFVYSPEFEAVHLRGGKVARGGIRWSDRREDFRTEILGLVKAQMVKNAVIVPVGAKGGFVVKRPPKSGDREEVHANGVHCYKTMIRALLDVTDNLDGDRVIPPPRVRRRDDDDPYLVVAADKGTATFSDIANAVSQEYGFWLDDAFASGGSAGYDHKKMGITARGAWEGVKRHFRERKRDIQTRDFTVVGVGDMSGDVFGNGMLLSEHTCLVAAFNHLHIFIDPNPDPARSHAERQRLFELPRSSWADYNRELLSAGGGIYDRQDLKIELSREARERLQISKTSISPQEVIQALLRAQVDLLWFGGIGTYVKASGETHMQAGDRANDDVRIDATELRAQVLGEGANLGITQAARIEYALRGGRINTDFIDNSGGVDCSDHEVNIKIAFAGAVSSGSLDLEQRNQHLVEMTDEVAGLVLRDNYLQSQSITLTETRGVTLLDEQERLMVELERRGQLNRRLEGLPDDATLADRRQAGKGLTRPEISVLLAASKIYVYNELLDSGLPDEEPLVGDLVRYFPKLMQEQFRDQILNHRLRREIIATHVTNSMLNRVGPTFVPRMEKETGFRASDIARAYTAARNIFDLRSFWMGIETLDNRVPADQQCDMAHKSVRVVEQVTRWLLRYGGRPLDISALVSRYEPNIILVAAQLKEMLPSRTRGQLSRAFKRLQENGVPRDLASRVTQLEFLPSACDVARCVAASGVGVEKVGKLYFKMGEIFSFDRLLRSARKLGGSDSWQQTAVMSLVEDLYSHQTELTRQVVTTEEGRPRAAIESWIQKHPDVARVRQVLKDIEAQKIDLAMLSVAERELRRLAERSLVSPCA